MFLLMGELVIFIIIMEIKNAYQIALVIINIKNQVNIFVIKKKIAILLELLIPIMNVLILVRFMNIIQMNA